MHPFLRPSFCASVLLSTGLSLCASLPSSIRLSVHPQSSAHLSVGPSFCPLASPSVRLSLLLSVCPCVPECVLPSPVHPVHSYFLLFYHRYVNPSVRPPFHPFHPSVPAFTPSSICPYARRSPCTPFRPSVLPFLDPWACLFVPLVLLLSVFTSVRPSIPFIHPSVPPPYVIPSVHPPIRLPILITVQLPIFHFPCP